MIVMMMNDDYEKHGDTDDDIVLNYDRLCYNSILHSSWSLSYSIIMGTVGSEYCKENIQPYEAVGAGITNVPHRLSHLHHHTHTNDA